MEYILKVIFNSGSSLDWEMISETNYDWEEIFEMALDINGTDNIRDLDFNCLVFAILTLAQNEFISGLSQKLEEYKNNEDYKEVIEKIKNFDFEDDEIWELSTNYSNNHFSLMVKDEEIADFLNNELEDFIDEINDNIGFCYLNIE